MDLPPCGLPGVIGTASAFSGYAPFETGLVFSSYGTQLDHYLAHFPRESLLLMCLEDLKRDPAGEIRRVLSFLGVDVDFQPALLGTSHHTRSD